MNTMWHSLRSVCDSGIFLFFPRCVNDGRESENKQSAPGVMTSREQYRAGSRAGRDWQEEAGESIWTTEDQSQKTPKDDRVSPTLLVR